MSFKHCSGEHSVNDCKGNQPARCANCSENHDTDTFDCPTYIKLIYIDHSKIGLNQYLQQAKADTVFPNETKKQDSANLFDKLTTISCMGGSSGSVALMLKNDIPLNQL